MRFVAIFSLVVSFLFAKPMYVENTIKAYSSSDGQKYQGKILPTTKLMVIKKQNSKAFVQIEGWTKNNRSQIIYYSKGKRILSVAFSKTAKFEIKKLSSEKFEENVWEKVLVSTWVEDKNLVKSIKPLYKKALNLFQSNCSICHPTPEINHFSPNQWPQVIKSMGERTALKKEELLLLTQYLQKHTNH